MGKTLFKDTLRRIRKTRGRFFAIMAIIAIGCGFFAGVKVTAPDMKKTADLYYNEQNLMDIHLMSTLGFNDEEIALLAASDSDISGISGQYSADLFIMTDNGTSPVAKVFSMDTALGEESPDYMDRPILLEGRMPQSPDECLIEAQTPAEFQLGNTITLSTNDDDNPTADILKTDTFTVVGRVSWVRYVNFERGTTTIGNGSIGSYLIVPKEAFSYEYYTDVYLTFASADGVDSFSDEYHDIIDAKTEQLELLAEEIHSKRTQELQDDLEEAHSELADGEAEYNDGLETFSTEIADAEKKLSDAENEIAEKEQELADGIAEYEDGLKKYNSGLNEISDNRNLLESKQADLDNARNQADSLRQLYSALEGFIAQAANIAAAPNDPNTAALAESLKILDTAEFSVSGAALAFASLPPDDPQKAFYAGALSQALSSLGTKITETDDALAYAQTELDNGFLQLNNAQAELDSAYKELTDAKALIDEGKTAIEEGKSELEEARQELQTQKADGEKELADAQAELADAREKLADGEKELGDVLDSLEWFAFDRDYNIGYASFGEDADRVDSIARVFPIFFILVAALVCLTTMTRMVEEQRTETGTLKALGYGNGVIMAQFLIYAASASIIGAVGGLLIGFNLFPRVIFQAYTLMYDYPDVICEFRWDYALSCTAAALLCTGLSSAFACYRELTVNPAQLMRPKPPKNGKRVILEKIPFIWKNLSFNMKVTARNVFRYKNRVLMTVLGIGGCTALMLAGFGLRYSISVIVDLQFGNIMKYDALCAFNAEDTIEYEALHSNIAENNDITEYLFGMQKSITVDFGGKTREAYAIVPENPEKIGSFVTMRDRASHESFELSEGGVIINEKLAKLLGIKKGDSIGFLDGKTQVTVAAVTENYSGNYVYFTPDVYKSVFGEYDNNIFYVNTADFADSDSVSEAILSSDCVMSVNFMRSSGDTFRQLVKNLNAIVIVIIASSGALAFVVLYNLSNINITERMRELATIKVLGFYDSEVASYIYRENVVSALLGMLAGLFGGIFLTRFVVQTAEVDVVMFCPDIPLHCFICAGVLTLVFTALVNAMLYFKLKKIDMAGSMKAIE